MADETDDPWEDLVLAILAVNQYSLEKTYLAVEALRGEGLFRPENLVNWSPEEIETRLRRGQCDRGDFMTRLFARRLASLGEFLKSAGVEECGRVLRKCEATEVRRLLLPVKGIGPKVLANFFLLRTGGAASAERT